MIGINAKRATPRSLSSNAVFSSNNKAKKNKNDNGDSQLFIVDLCETDFKKRAETLKEAIRSSASILTTEPVSKTFDSSNKTLELFQRKGKRLAIIDPIAHHPLITLARKEISEGKIGEPRILRLESIVHDRVLSEFALTQALIHALRACELLFEPMKVTRVFAKKIKTRSSILFVIIANLGEGGTAHIIAGNSSSEGKFEFSINGTRGMLSFNESRTLELPGGVEYSNALKASGSVEVLTSAFSEIMTTTNNSSTLLPTPNASSLSQRLVECVLESVRKSVPVKIIGG